MTDKRRLLDQLLADLAREIDVLTAAARATREAATHEEARPENDKDTRALEASYLAGAQAERVRDLRETRAALAALPARAFAPGEPVMAGALVAAQAEGEAAPARFFLAPAGGGLRAELAGLGPVQVVTPRSPLGQALLGRCVGDLVEVPARGALREYEIVAVD